MADFISDLRKNIKTARIEEGKQLFTQLKTPSEEDQQAIVEMLALAPDHTALELIGFLMETKILPSIQERLYQLSTDRAHLNYGFTRLLLAHGSQDQIRQTLPLLRHILTKETQGEILNLIIRTAGKLKMEALTESVAEFIFYDDPDLKREAVKALERMENKRALQHLEHIATTDKSDMDILDAIDMLKERLGTEEIPTPKTEPQLLSVEKAPATPTEETEKSLESHVSQLASGRLEERFESYTYFSENNDLVADALHQNLETESHDLLINLLRLTARTIPRDSVGDLLELAAREKLEKNIHFSLLHALAAFPELESAATVLEAATDTAMHVRLAAIRVLDHHCSDYISAEIKKRIETGTKKGEALGVSILDAGAVHIIDSLMASDTFSYITSNYLERNAPVQSIDTYLTVLENRNRLSTLKKYRGLRNERAEEKRPFMVVIHPNPAYLHVYTKLIHNCGFDVRSFTAPQEAFESIVFEKPAAVVCDLFLRQFSVLELAKEIRELYSRTEVPIIVSTLQTELDKTALDKTFDTAGINKLCNFPATASQIKSWVSAR